MNGGKAVRIIEIDENHTPKVYENELNKIFLDPRIAEKKVVIVSVAGPYRMGKSFVLNFFLRYLQSNGSDEWMGCGNNALEGFSWKRGNESDTNGILLWSEPFLITLPGGEEVAVLLMDSQGSFDHRSTIKDCATIFALSTLISSVQIYNLMNDIQENDLTNLQLFSEYGKQCEEEGDTFDEQDTFNSMSNKPFQQLQFLVRDWENPDDYEYGFEDGKKFLRKILQVNETQHVELQQLRKHIDGCFDSLRCFLMPFPGIKVATGDVNGQEYRGELTLLDMDEDFRKELKTFVEGVLKPNKLILKEIRSSKTESNASFTGDKTITCRELLENCIKEYVRVLKEGEIPEPKTILAVTKEANRLVQESRRQAEREAALRIQEAKERAAAEAIRIAEQRRQEAEAEEARILAEADRRAKEQADRIAAGARERAEMDARRTREEAMQRAAEEEERLKAEAKARADNVLADAAAAAAAIRPPLRHVRIFGIKLPRL